MTSKRMTVISYLKNQLGKKGDFMAEYKRLSPDERESLRNDARAEMAALGIEEDSAKQLS